MPQRINNVKEDVTELIQSVDWNQFQDQDTLVPMIEVHAALIGTVKKMDSIIKNIMSDTYGKE